MVPNIEIIILKFYPILCKMLPIFQTSYKKNIYICIGLEEWNSPELEGEKNDIFSPSCEAAKVENKLFLPLTKIELLPGYLLEIKSNVFFCILSVRYILKNAEFSVTRRLTFLYWNSTIVGMLNNLDGLVWDELWSGKKYMRQVKDPNHLGAKSINYAAGYWWHYRHHSGFVIYNIIIHLYS